MNYKWNLGSHFRFPILYIHKNIILEDLKEFYNICINKYQFVFIGYMRSDFLGFCLNIIW